MVNGRNNSSLFFCVFKDGGRVQRWGDGDCERREDIFFCVCGWDSTLLSLWEEKKGNEWGEKDGQYAGIRVV